jgi:hypothetical protein
LVRAITEEQIEIMRDPRRAPTAKLPRIEDAVRAGGVLCGNADDLIEHIKALERKYPGLDRISVSLSVGVPEKVALEQLDRFAKEVMPALKKPRHHSRCWSADQPDINQWNEAPGYVLYAAVTYAIRLSSSGNSSILLLQPTFPWE